MRYSWARDCILKLQSLPEAQEILKYYGFQEGVDLVTAPPKARGLPAGGQYQVWAIAGPDEGELDSCVMNSAYWNARSYHVVVGVALEDLKPGRKSVILYNNTFYVITNGLHRPPEE